MTRLLEIARNDRRQRRPMTFARASACLVFLLAAASWGYILLGTDSGVGDLVSTQTWSDAGRFFGRLLGIGVDTQPAYFQADQWVEKGKLAYQTLAMSVLAISIAGIGAFLTFLPGSRNVSSGDLGGAPSHAGFVTYCLFRWFFTVTRAVPELVWAMIIVFFLSPGILPGALALALHNYGVLAKLSSEVVENVDPGPARSLRSSGAGGFQMLLYGILPQTLPQFVTYLLYRWEVVIRTTVVVGFVSATGLGREFRLSLSFFHYTELGLIIFWYLLLVIGVDLLCAWMRRLAR